MIPDDSSEREPTAAVEQYVDELTRRIADALGAKLHAIALTGSAVLGDFDPARSDLDLMVVTEGPLGQPAVARLAAGLSHGAVPCPAAGLDLAAFQRTALLHPERPIRYEFGLETGARWGTRRHPAGAESELALDLAFARRHGLAKFGPSPAVCIAAIPRTWVLDAISTTIRWHETALYDPFHDPTGAQAVLNACRGLYFCRHGRFVSKADAAQWAEREGWRIARRALSGRLATSRRLPRAIIVEFLEATAREVQASG